MSSRNDAHAHSPHGPPTTTTTTIITIAMVQSFTKRNHYSGIQKLFQFVIIIMMVSHTRIVTRITASQHTSPPPHIKPPPITLEERESHGLSLHNELSRAASRQVLASAGHCGGLTRITASSYSHAQHAPHYLTHQASSHHTSRAREPQPRPPQPAIARPQPPSISRGGPRRAVRLGVSGQVCAYSRPQGAACQAGRSFIKMLLRAPFERVCFRPSAPQSDPISEIV